MKTTPQKTLQASFYAFMRCLCSQWPLFGSRLYTLLLILILYFFNSFVIQSISVFVILIFSYINFFSSTSDNCHHSPLDSMFPFPGDCSSFGGFIIPLSIYFLILLSLDISLFCILNNCCIFAKVSEDLSAPGNSPLFSVLLTVKNSPLSLRDCNMLWLDYRLYWIHLIFKAYVDCYKCWCCMVEEFLQKGNNYFCRLSLLRDSSLTLSCFKNSLLYKYIMSDCRQYLRRVEA